MLRYLVLTISFLIIHCAKEDIVDYYVKIYKENMDEIRSWKRPVFNEEFRNYSNNHCEDFGKFDFIVVGAGTAGAVVASRISEIFDWSVLLLEAGEDDSDFSLIPGVAFQLLNTKMNWAYLTTPQEKACNNNPDNRCDFATGKTLGGGSGINGMMYVRGNKHDFDLWEKQGAQGWSYKNVLPYFKKAENLFNISLSHKYHGLDGNIRVTYPQPEPTLLSEVIKSNEEMGVKNGDYNGEKQMVVGRTQVNIKNGRRHSTNQAYLKPIRKSRKNLKILTKALATKVLFEDKTAKGVQFLHEGKCKQAFAKNEVILSAGPVNTPQLLQLSGVGPKEQLQRFNIKPIAILPVGENLEDHPCLFFLEIDTNQEKIRPSLEQKIRDYLNGQGVLTQSPGAELSFHNVTPAEHEDYPDIEFIYSVANDLVNVNETYNEEKQRIKMSISMILLHPKSIGWVRLNSTDPTDFPLIEPKFLQHPYDMEIFYLGIKRIERMLENPTLKKIGAKFSENLVPKCNDFKGDHRKYWECVIIHKVSGNYHPIATTRIGKDSSSSVVDKNLKIHGVKNLRVADNGIVPFGTSGHMNAVAVMIGERASDLIKFDHLHVKNS